MEEIAPSYDVIVLGTGKQHSPAFLSRLGVHLLVWWGLPDGESS